jgi:hypothetical protein
MVASLSLARASIRWTIFMRSSWINWSGSCVSSRVGSSFRPRRRRAVMKKGTVEMKGVRTRTRMMKTVRERQRRRMRERRSRKGRKKERGERLWRVKRSQNGKPNPTWMRKRKQKQKQGSRCAEERSFPDNSGSPTLGRPTGPSDGVHGCLCQRRDTFGGRRHQYTCARRDTGHVLRTLTCVLDVPPFDRD